MKIKRLLGISFLVTILITSILAVVPVHNYARCVSLEELTDNNSQTAELQCPGKQYGWPYAWKQDYSSADEPDFVFPEVILLNASIYFVSTAGLIYLIERTRSHRHKS